MLSFDGDNAAGMWQAKWNQVGVFEWAKNQTITQETAVKQNELFSTCNGIIIMFA